MGGLYKKSEAGLLVILIIIIVFFFFGWLINVGQRECKSNRDCGSESYCGSDFACHTYPTIQKTVVQYNLFWPAVVIGVAIVAVALIFKWNKTRTEEKTVEKQTIVKVQQEEPVEVEEIAKPYYRSEGKLAEPYYKSTTNTRSP